MLPRRAVLAAEELGGFGIVGDHSLLRIEGKGTAAQLHGEVCEDAAGCGDVALFDVRDWLAAFFDRGQEIQHVQACGGRSIQLDVLFRNVLWELLLFEQTVEMERLLIFGPGDEIRAHGARLKSSVFAVDEKRPRIIGIGRGAPCAVLPNGVEIIELEHRSLRVRDIRFAVLLNENAAGRSDAFWPAESEHPAGGVQHVNAHVAQDAVAIL